MLIDNSEHCIESAKIIQQNFITNRLKLATAESCTSGLLAATLTHHAGSSQFFMGGVNVYSNQAKIDLLNINPTALHQYGAVSAQVAEQMAQGALDLFHADFSIAVTGVAGPSGGTPDKPVGTIYLAFGSHHTCKVERLSLTKDRLRNRSMVCLIALQKLLNFVETQRGD